MTYIYFTDCIRHIDLKKLGTNVMGQSRYAQRSVPITGPFGRVINECAGNHEAPLTT